MEILQEIGKPLDQVAHEYVDAIDTWAVRRVWRMPHCFR